MSGIAPEPERCQKCHNTMCVCVGGQLPGPASGSALYAWKAIQDTRASLEERLRFLPENGGYLQGLMRRELLWALGVLNENARFAGEQNTEAEHRNP